MELKQLEEVREDLPVIRRAEYETAGDSPPNGGERFLSRLNHEGFGVFCEDKTRAGGVRHHLLLMSDAHEAQAVDVLFLAIDVTCCGKTPRDTRTACAFPKVRSSYGDGFLRFRPM